MAQLNTDLETIKTARDNMKIALEDKGQIVTKDIRTYADAISSINTGSGDVKLFKTIEKMNQDPNIQENDLAVVYNKSTKHIDEETIFDNVVFPKSITLDEPISLNYIAYFNDVSSGTRVLTIRLNMGLSCEIIVEYNKMYSTILYESSDGQLFIRQDDKEEDINFVFKNGLIFQDTGSMSWNDIISNFVITVVGEFNGVYEAIKVETVDKGKLYTLDLSNIVNNDFTVFHQNYVSISDIENILAKTPFASSNYKVADIVYTDNKYYIFPYYRSGATYSGICVNTVDKHIYFVAEKDDEWGYIKIPFDLYIYDEDTDSVTVKSGNDYQDVIMKWGNGPYSYNKIIEILQDNNSFGVRYIKTSNSLENLPYFVCNTLPMTEAKNVSIEFVTNTYDIQTNLVYSMANTQLDCVKDFVGEDKIFYGKNGVETGTMQILKYPYPYSEYKNYDYEFFTASSIKQNVDREGDLYVLATYQPVPSGKPDTWALTGNRKMKLGLSYSQLASAIGLNSSVIKKGVTILGITGTYEGTTS